MRSGVIAQKVGMTRVFTEAGEHIPVTVLKLGNCQVLGHRTTEKNGYVALQLGSGTRKTVYLPKAERGQFAVAKVEPKRKVAEFRVSEDALIPVGAEIQPPLEPGTAPSTRIRPRSTSVCTTRRLSVVMRSTPIWPGIFLFLKVLPGS